MYCEDGHVFKVSNRAVYSMEYDYDNINLLEGDYDEYGVKDIIEHLNLIEPLEDEDILEDTKKVQRVSLKEHLSRADDSSQDEDSIEDIHNIKAIVGSGKQVGDTSNNKHLSLAAMFKVVVSRRRLEVGTFQLIQLVKEIDSMLINITNRKQLKDSLLKDILWEELIDNSPQIVSELATNRGVYFKVSPKVLANNEETINRLIQIGAIHYATTVDKDNIYYLSNK